VVEVAKEEPEDREVVEEAVEVVVAEITIMKEAIEDQEVVVEAAVAEADLEEAGSNMTMRMVVSGKMNKERQFK
jgi:hypothetical protein